MTVAHLRDAYPLLDGSVTTGKGPNTYQVGQGDHAQDDFYAWYLDHLKMAQALGLNLSFF